MYKWCPSGTILRMVIYKKKTLVDELLYVMVSVNKRYPLYSENISATHICWWVFWLLDNYDRIGKFDPSLTLSVYHLKLALLLVITLLGLGSCNLFSQGLSWDYNFLGLCQVVAISNKEHGADILTFNKKWSM